MSVNVGSGEYRYEVVEGWGKLPDGWTFKEVAAVAIDSKDQVYCFTRGDHPSSSSIARGATSARGAREFSPMHTEPPSGPTIPSF